MPIRQPQYPIRFSPKGLVDALDATDKFQGACIVLRNLIFDQSNPEIMISRPGVSTALTTFSGFITPGAISVQITVGTRTYGMIASGLNSGKDEPFSYDHATSTFDTISGVTNANSPTTQATTGAWTPPTMAVVGTRVIVTHPGFAGGATKFGVLNIATVTAPAWTATDTATNNLSAVPSAVANFANRAYFAVNQFLEFTDVLDPLTRTNGTQVLTVGDTNVIRALSGLPVQTTSSGVIQALMVFKDFQVWQVTGDAALSTLALNFLSLTVGSSAPRSIALSPLGLYFASISGPYIITQLGTVQLVTRSSDEIEADIVAPFQNAVTPSRIAGGYSNGVYRVCIETVIRSVTATNDYWFDERRRRWTGPHSFSFDCASQFSNYFVLVSNANTAALYRSRVVPDANTLYDDAGTATSATLQSSAFPKTGRMTEKQVVESTQELSSSGVTTTYNITAQDDQQNTLNTAQITIASGGTWGSGVWGSGALWVSSTNRPHVYNVPWTAPLVFKKLVLLIQATATVALAIGSHFSRYADTGYSNAPNE